MTISTWDKPVSGERSVEILVDLALEHCRRAGAVADELAGYITARNFAAVCKYELNYREGYTVAQYVNLRQALAFFTKVEDLDIGVDKEAVARTKFWQAERDCLRTNDIFWKWSRGDFCFHPDVERVLFLAQRKIAHFLGDVPGLSDLKLVFGKGATTSVPKRNACAGNKLSAVPSCSPNLLPLVPDLLSELPHLLQLHGVESEEKWDVRIEVNNARLAFVPKNAKTFRSVATEPTLNAMLQGGYGKFMADKLRSIGQSTRNQERNQLLAREGSLTGALATLDLSSASDTISTELVAHLLPLDWYFALAECRSPSIEDGGSVIRLHKFSSMGNGFTFPLQTLIFWALATSCRDLSNDPEQRVSVYGDDIIVGTATVPMLRRVLHDVGFTLNREKSYWEGGFRESCGKDYYLGFDIRPCYVKSWLSGESLFILHNFYVRGWDHEMAERVKGFLDPELVLYGPDGYGDGHLVTDDWIRTPHKRRRGWAGYTFDTYVHIGLKTSKPKVGDRVLPCYSVYVREDAPVTHQARWSAFVYTPEEILARDGPVVTDRGIQTEHAKTRSGVWKYPVETLPGTEGYKRISIYTLTP